MFSQVERGHLGFLTLEKHRKAHVGTNTGISSKKMGALKQFILTLTLPFFRGSQPLK